MSTNGLAQDAKRVIVALITASIIGAWTFAGTRASTEDVEAVESELARVEAEGRQRIRELQQNVEEIKATIQREAVEAAAFRAQVRHALGLRDADQ